MSGEFLLSLTNPMINLPFIFFVKTFNITNPLNIFCYEPNEDGTMGDGISLETSNKIVNQFLEKRKFTLSEYVKIANLPFLQTSTTAIFGDYDSLEDAYKDIESGGVDFIAKKLSIAKSDNISIRALRVYDTLMQFKNDLLECVNDVEIIKTNNEDVIKLTAVCSDEVGYPFKTKADFLLDEIRKGNLFPIISPYWYNTIELFRYWPPFTYYVIAVEKDGKKYYIVGNICMDMLFVKVDDFVNVNDEVIILKDNNHIEEVASHLETIPYEILCSISKRVPRICKE